MAPIEEYLDHADELAQSVIDAWGQNVKAGNAALFREDFKALLQETFRYWDAKKIADNHRAFAALSESEAAKESAARLAFAQAYKAYWEKHQEAAPQIPAK